MNSQNREMSGAKDEMSSVMQSVVLAVKHLETKSATSPSLHSGGGIMFVE